MAKNPDTKNKKSDSSPSSTDTAKTETSSGDTSKPDVSSATGDSTSKDGRSSAPSRPISYFASISTNEYRSGWDGVFGKGGRNTKGSTSKGSKKTTKKLPLTITIQGDDLDEKIRQQLEAVFRQRIKKKRLNYDKLSSNGQVTLEVSCRISSA